MGFVKKLLTLSILLGLAFTLACGNPMSKRVTASALSSSNPIKEDFWAALDTEGFVSNGPYGNYKAIEIDKVNQTLILSVPLPKNPLRSGVKEDIKDLPGATVEIDKDAQGDWYLKVTVPLIYVAKGMKSTDPEKLPNGKPLPRIPGGELPKVGLQIQNGNYEFYLYLSSTVAGLFVPTPGFNPYIELDFEIHNSKKTKVLGYFSTVKEEGSFDGGFFTSFMLPPALSRAIDDLF